MTPTRLKRRHDRKGVTADSHMTLVPFIDFMVILVVFLLMHTSETEILPAAKGISIPQSVADMRPRETVLVTVTPDAVFVNGHEVATTAAVRSGEAMVVEPLKLALQQQAARVLAQPADGPEQPREVTIMGDKSVPYAVLRKVMATCTDADYGKVSLVVVEKETAVGGTTA
jgi:biopolymer transport protein ExbD